MLGLMVLGRALAYLDLNCNRADLLGYRHRQLDRLPLRQTWRDLMRVRVVLARVICANPVLVLVDRH